MHRYLNIHRNIWEKIAEVKERGKIRGSEIAPFRAQIESYDKTVNLIEARINQMDTYIKTRGSITRATKEFSKFTDVLQFKYETLSDTLEYVKDIWAMTKNYVASSLDLFGKLQAQSAESSIRNLTVITSMGVGATLIGLFSQKPPEFSLFGLGYFFALAVIGYSTDKIMRKVYLSRTYKIKDVKVSREI